MDAVLELSSFTGMRAACDSLGVARASLYRPRSIQGPVVKGSAPRAVERRASTAPARSLSATERGVVLGHLHEERFQDRSPAAVYATLPDEGIYHCSIRTMYRLLEAHGEAAGPRGQTCEGCWTQLKR